MINCVLLNEKNESTTTTYESGMKPMAYDYKKLNSLHCFVEPKESENGITLKILK